MTQIVLTPEQASLYHQAKEPVQICDTQGTVLCTLTPSLTPEFVAELKRRAAAPGPRYSGDDIQAMFRYLEETWEREGKFDERRMHELIDQFDSERKRHA